MKSELPVDPACIKKELLEEIDLHMEMVSKYLYFITLC